MTFLRRCLPLPSVAIGIAITAATVVPAFAAPPDPGGAPQVMDPFNYTDSHGIRIDQYQLSFGQGDLFSVNGKIAGFFLYFGWEIYRWMVGFLAWLVDWVTSLGWVSVIETPITDAAHAISVNVIGPAGLMAFMLAVLGFIFAWRLARGRMGSAFTEMVVGGFIAALAGIVLANPVAVVTDGPLQHTRQFSIELANMISDENFTYNDDSGATKTGMTAGTVIVDSLLRPMHSQINYGVDIDAEPCRDTYDKVLKAGPYGPSDAEKPRQAMQSCNQAYGKYTEVPGFMAVATLFWFTGVFVLIFLVIVAVCGLTFWAVFRWLWAALTLTYTIVLGVAGSDARAPLFRSIADILTSAILLVANLASLALILRIVRAAISLTDWPMASRLFIIAATLLAGIGVIVSGWRRSRTSAERLVDKLKSATGTPGAPRGEGGVAPQVREYMRHRLYHLRRKSSGSGGRTTPGPSSAGSGGATGETDPTGSEAGGPNQNGTQLPDNPTHRTSDGEAPAGVSSTRGLVKNHVADGHTGSLGATSRHMARVATAASGRESGRRVASATAAATKSDRAARAKAARANLKARALGGNVNLLGTRQQATAAAKAAGQAKSGQGVKAVRTAGGVASQRPPRTHLLSTRRLQPAATTKVAAAKSNQAIRATPVQKARVAAARTAAGSNMGRPQAAQAQVRRPETTRPVAAAKSSQATRATPAQKARAAAARTARATAAATSTIARNTEQPIVDQQSTRRPRPRTRSRITSGRR
ncbi:MAG: hypothetical protein WAX29_03940 [Propionibacterium sp.]